MDLASRAMKLSPSLTLEVKAKADKLREKGSQIIDLGIGVPDFFTAESVKNAANKAIERNFTKYTASSGIIELKEAIGDKYKREYGVSYSTNEIIISAGAKQALFNVALVLFDPGDEVILPSPYWTSFPEPIRLAGAKPVILETRESNGFVPKVEEIEEKTSSKTKALIINSPNNPSGTVIEKDELDSIIELARKRNFYIISDEIYEKFVYEGRPVSASEFGKENLIIVNSVSKAHAMTGWRIGFAMGAEKVINAMSNLQSHSTGCPTSISQKAALEAIREDRNRIKEKVREYDKRRNFLVEKMNYIDRVTLAEPKGAFFAFPNISSYFNGKIDNSMVFSQYLLDRAQVAVVPGKAFGNDGYIRISFGAPMDQIQEGLKRLKNFLGSHFE